MVFALWLTSSRIIPFKKIIPSDLRMSAWTNREAALTEVEAGTAHVQFTGVRDGGARRVAAALAASSTLTSLDMTGVLLRAGVRERA